MTHPKHSFPSAVRLPSHINPPFRARQWLNFAVGPNPAHAGNQGQIQFSIDDITQTYSVDWGSAQATFQATSGLVTRDLSTNLGVGFPDGMLGVLSWLNFSMRFTGAGTNNFFPATAFDWSLYLNGALIPGFVSQPFSCWRQAGVATLVMGYEMPILAPVHLRGGDRVDIEVRQVSGGTFSPAIAQVGGWLYPEHVAGDAGSIRQTSADPGAQSPLD